VRKAKKKREKFSGKFWNMGWQKSIGTLLKKPLGQLESIIHQVNHIKALQRVLVTVLDDKLAAHCQVADFKKGVLTIAVDQSVWLARIRFQSADLIEQLQKKPSFQNITKINGFVQMGEFKPVIKLQIDPTRNLLAPYGLSESNVQLLQETAQHISHPSLKASLLKLAKHAKKSTSYVVPRPAVKPRGDGPRDPKILSVNKFM
jgi:hypothetical protein